VKCLYDCNQLFAFTCNIKETTVRQLVEWLGQLDITSTIIPASNKKYKPGGLAVQVQHLQQKSGVELNEELYKVPW
jgi:hypothetical protein